MTLEILHRSERKLPQMIELNEAHAECDAASATKAKPAEISRDPHRSPQAEGHACAWSPNGRAPSAPKTDQAANENPADSFDALTARLNTRFDTLVAAIEQMRKELCEAEERSEQLRQKLVRNGTIRG